MSDLDRELEAELHRVLDPVASSPIPARRAVGSRGPVRALVGGAGAAVTIKILTGVAVAAAALTVAGAATTHSLNPTVWGQQVEQQVQTCKTQLAAGQHGIGDCVSDFANQHGQTVASDARHHGDGAADGTAKPKDNNGNGTGKDKPKPRESPPSGEPSEPTDPSSHAVPPVSPKP